MHGAGRHGDADTSVGERPQDDDPSYALYELQCQDADLRALCRRFLRRNERAGLCGALSDRDLVGVDHGMGFQKTVL